MTSRAENLISLLNIENRNEVIENLNETIQNYKEGTDKAATMLDYLFEQLQLDNLDEEARTEIKNELLLSIKSAAGYHLTENYLWDTGTRLAPLRETTVTGADIVGKDSNLQGDLYHRRKDKDGLHRQEPKKRNYDEDEKEIEKKLAQLKKLFNDRNKKKITLTDIKKILQSESIEFRSSVKQKMRAASALIEDDPSCEDELLEHYFTEGIILEDSASGTSSSTSWSNWQGITHQVVISRDGIVKSSNTFLCRIGDMMDKEKYDYLISKGVRIIEN